MLGTMRDSYPTHEKNLFITYKTYFPIEKLLNINKIARKKKFELMLELTTLHVSGERFIHCTIETDIN